MLITAIPVLDELLEAHARQLGTDAIATRNHTYRVTNICGALRSGDRAQLDKIAIAAAVHDLGIWTDRLHPLRFHARDR
jgi:HD superfamily phosphodiesterase